jgi:hypothetical protein
MGTSMKKYRKVVLGKVEDKIRHMFTRCLAWKNQATAHKIISVRD